MKRTGVPGVVSLTYCMMSGGMTSITSQKRKQPQIKIIKIISVQEESPNITGVNQMTPLGTLEPVVLLLKLLFHSLQRKIPAAS